MNNIIYKLARQQSYLKFIFSFLLLFYSNLAMSQQPEVCNKLECIDELQINKSFVKYYSILNKTLIDARGCHDDNKLDVIIEFTAKIKKSVGSRERMAKFIEREFIHDPVCILSAMKRASKEAKYATSLYLAKPGKFNKGKIYPILKKYEKQFPDEINLVLLRRNEISNIKSK